MKINSFEKRSNSHFCKDTGAFLLSNMRKIGFFIILFVLLVVGGVYIFSAFNKKNVYIDSFAVSDLLGKQGITGIWVANQILDKVAVIRETKLDRYKREYLNLLIINSNSKVEKATVPIVNYRISEIRYSANFI